jgi:hypothetical protein
VNLAALYGVYGKSRQKKILFGFRPEFFTSRKDKQKSRESKQRLSEFFGVNQIQGFNLIFDSY